MLEQARLKNWPPSWDECALLSFLYVKVIRILKTATTTNTGLEEAGLTENWAASFPSFRPPPSRLGCISRFLLPKQLNRQPCFLECVGSSGLRGHLPQVLCVASTRRPPPCLCSPQASAIPFCPPSIITLHPQLPLGITHTACATASHYTAALLVMRGTVAPAHAL